MKQLSSFILSVLMVIIAVASASAGSTETAETGKTVVQIGDWMFEKINNDTQWELDEYVGEGGRVLVPRIVGDLLIVQLGDHCFSNNTNVTDVVTSSPLIRIGEYAFVNCTTIQNFECNYALRTIESGAFSGTSALKTINLETSIITEVMPYTFLNSGIESIRLPETCTKLGIYSFAQCDNLTKIIIPDSVTEIADTAFESDENLVIYCNTDSYAHEYAEAKGIDYVLTDEPQEVSFILGDADGDSKITILDATKIQRLLAALVTDDDGMISLRGDTDGNGLDILDATKIQRYLAAFTVAEPIGTSATKSITLT